MKRNLFALGIATIAVLVAAVAAYALLKHDDEPAGNRAFDQEAFEESLEKLPRLEGTLLRLVDLPKGYEVGDDSGCGALTPEGRPPALDALLGMNFPPTCVIEFQLAPEDEGPHSIKSAVVELPDEQFAESVMTVVSELARRIIGTDVALVPEPYGFEDEAALLRFRDSNTQDDGLVLVWRSEKLIHLLSVSGDVKPDLLRYTHGLAEKQQARAEDPEPIRPQDNDDRTVSIDRTDLGAPVYWLGLDFAPYGHPRMTYEDGGGLREGSSPGNKLRLSYAPIDTRPVRGGVELAVWDIAEWQAFISTLLGDRSTSQPCVEPTIIQLADRRIEIHAPGSKPSPPLHLPAPQPEPSGQHQPSGGGPNTVEDQCPPNYVGHVYFVDAVVVINGIWCTACYSAGNPYDSAAGIEAIGRALMKR